MPYIITALLIFVVVMTIIAKIDKHADHKHKRESSLPRNKE